MLSSKKNDQKEVDLKRFSDTVWGYYEKHGRDLLWRRTNNPYHILVSEMMLQQTQVSRVVEKYQIFLKKFPTLTILAKARLEQVVECWQGLGYNRRAKYVWQSARMIVDRYKGVVPADPQILDTLPGIGIDTAGAICAYAFNQPVVFIETNIRTVFIRHFFPNRKKVFDSELRPLVLKTLDQKNPKVWYSALMDYGSFLKSVDGKYTKKSASYVKQKPFKGSVREVRGFLLKEVIREGRVEKAALEARFDKERVRQAIVGLVSDELITYSRGFLRAA